MYATKRRRRSLKGFSTSSKVGGNPSNVMVFASKRFVFFKDEIFWICLFGLCGAYLVGVFHIVNSFQLTSEQNNKNSKSGCDNPCNGTSSGSSLKSNPSKRHRERLNSELERLASLLPFEANILNKLDKLSILRLSVSYLRIKSYFQVLYQREHAVNYDTVSVGGSVGLGLRLGTTGAGQTANGTLAAHGQSKAEPTQGHEHQNVSKLLDHFTLDPSLTRMDSVLKALNGFILVLTTIKTTIGDICDVFFASETIEEFLGFHQSDVIHQDICDLIHSEDRAELRKIMCLTRGSQSQQGSSPVLERCISARFRCLLDNTSGFLRLEIRGRIGILHGQNCHTGEPQLGLLAICCPFGPPTLLDNISKDSGFKSKHKLDLFLISIDARGKSLLGYDDDSSGGPARNFYNWLHPDDLFFVGSAHRTIIKTGSCNLLAYRVATKSAQWQWLQTTLKTVFKNGKPDHISATHLPIGEEEARDRLSKRDAAVRDSEIDPDKLFVDDGLITRTTKSKKRTSPSGRENTELFGSTLGSTLSSHDHVSAPSRRRKSISTDGSPRAVADSATYTANLPYCGLQPDACLGGSLSGSLNYRATAAYSAAILDPSRLFSADTLSVMPYPQYTTGFYSASDTLPQSANLAATGFLDSASKSPYDWYSQAGYSDTGLPASTSYSPGVSYLKSYYKGADVYPNGETVPRLNSSYGSYSSYEPSLNGAGSSSGSLPGNIHSPYQISSNKPSNPTSAWLSHHRQSVVVWNNGSRQTEQPSNFKPSSSAWSATGHGETGRSVYSRLQPSAFSSTSSDGRQSGSTRGLQEEKDRIHPSSNLRDKPPVIHGANFSISEATNTLLDSAG